MSESAADAESVPDLASHQLTEAQDVLLRTMATPFVRSGTWPVFDYVVSTMDEDFGLDARGALRSLPRVPDSLSMIGRPSYGFTTLPPDAVRDDTRLGLTVAASLALPEFRSLFGEPFMRVMHYMIRAYREAPSDVNAVKQVWLTAAELQAAVPISSEIFWIALPAMLEAEVATRRGSQHTTPEGSWRREVTREILQFRSCHTVDQYVAKVSETVTGWAHEQDQQLGRVIPASGQLFSRPSIVAMPEETTAASHSGHAVQDLRITAGENSRVVINAPFAYADKGASASSVASPKGSHTPIPAHETEGERSRGGSHRKRWVWLGVATITVSAAAVIATLIPGAGSHSTNGTPSDSNSVSEPASDGNSTRPTGLEAPPKGTCAHTCRIMRIGGSRNFDIDSWGVNSADSLGDLTSSGLTVTASRGATIRAVQYSGRLNVADCPVGGKQGGSIRISDGQRACLTTAQGHTVMIQRHLNTSLPYSLFYADLDFIPSA